MLRSLVTSCLLIAFTGTVSAQLFTEDWDDGLGSTRWSTPITAVETSTLPFEGSVDYNFDYSVLGAPSAPNSTGGTTTGVFMETNTTESGAVAEGESVGIVPLSFDLPADNYILTSDVYIFWNLGGGSTEYATLGIGHDRSDNVPFRFQGDSPTPFDGSGFAWQIDSDGDSGTDLIRYDEAFGQQPLDPAEWEDIPDGSIPGVTTGGAAPTGPFNTWVELSVKRENDIVEFAINGFVLDTFDTGGDFAAARTLLLGQSDPFNSVNVDDINGNSNGVVFDNVRVVEIISGDYNGNGVVDAADYTLWRDTLGDSVTAGTGADGDGDGNIGPGDYTVWQTNFGNGAPSASASVPEPSTLVGAFALLGGLMVRRRA